MYYLYILKNKKGSYYIGTTNNIIRRIQEHNNGKSKATKNRGPWNIVYTEKFRTRSQAMKREYYIKSQKSKKFIKNLVEKDIS
ncbi:MAG: GIY-YIG nuclease family protein [Candidatus Cloacimonetes bacterium]|nr:GIY-YIG nuclease family protein [Candidatus Cloacimonadota bacterium]